MRRLLSLSALMLLPLALSSCLRDQGNPTQQTAMRAPQNTLASFATRSEPVFGNTATNLQRIRQKPYTGKIRLVIMGDNRNSSPFSHGADKIYAKVIEKVNELKPDFAVNVGDFTFDNLKPHWKDFERITSAVKVPYLTVVGNHDVLFGRSYYESSYTPPNPETGLDDYAFDYGNTRFIALDTANFTITDRQFAWYERQLQTPLKKILFTHTPPRHGVWEHKLSPSPAVSQRFLALNTQHKVDYVFLGHIHLYDQRQVNGIDYIVSGGGGAPMDQGREYGQSVYHVVLVDIDASGVKTQMIPIQTRVVTKGPTTYSTGLDTPQLVQPQVGSKYPGDFIPPEEQMNDR